jgi:hypothetical protein
MLFPLRIHLSIKSIATYPRAKGRYPSIVIATLLSCVASFGQGIAFPFHLDGAHAPAGPNPVPSYADGTLTYTPGLLTLSMTYQLTSPGHEIICGISYGNGAGLVLAFHSAPPDLPPTGTITRTRGGDLIDDAVLDALLHGRVTLSVSTENYPFSCCGEIGGTVMLPPPPPFPTVACSGLVSTNCGNLALVNATITEPAGRAFIAVWRVNGTIAQTLQFAATGASNVTNLTYSADLPVGTNLVDLAVTNSLTNAASCSTLVSVVDAVAPVLQCPADVVIEATNEANLFFYAPVATDACSGAIPITCIPPSGSLFPPGTNTVTCFAADTSQNTNQCSFTVTVLGARKIKESVLAEILGVVESLESPNGPLLARASDHLARSVETTLWIDEMHLVRNGGGRVFAHEQKAVHALSSLQKRPENDFFYVVLAMWIDRLVNVDRLLATLEIQAAALGNASDQKLKRTGKALSAGDAAVAQQRYPAAIQRYHQAWEAARLPPAMTGP